MTPVCRGRVASLALVALVAIIGASAPASAARPSATARLDVLGSPFDPDGDGRRDAVRIVLAIDADARVDLGIDDFDGRRVRTLASGVDVAAGEHDWRWDGRTGSGRRVRPGAYRATATIQVAGSGAHRRSTWVTVAGRVPYQVRPGAILVALDPGHGGIADGAVWRGLKEDDVNLDIGLRLEAMLQGAGVRVQMSRRVDRFVDPDRLDLDGDGRFTRPDELIARNDLANMARADVHIAIHNNATDCRCVRGTEIYTHHRRAWSPEGFRLARYVLGAHLRHLRRIDGFRPRDLGVTSFPFMALRPYHPRKMPRPSLQPSILGESLFVDQPSEHRVLSRRDGRTAIAAAYFDGIARFLNARRFGLRYEILDAPPTVRQGGALDIRLRLTNTGNALTSGWRLKARVVKSVFRYDGRPRRGRVVAGVRVPDGVAPGESIELVLPDVRMPRAARRWLVKLDVDLGRGDSLSGHGVVGPQLRVRTTPR